MILPGSSSTGATTSASPASIALRGMPSNLAEPSACTNAAPAFSLMARRPSVPSEPMPERMTPMLRSCWSSASERKKKSIGRFRPRGDACGRRCSAPCRSDMSLFGRDHVDVVGLDLQPVLGLRDRHGRRALQQLDQHALVRGVEVLDDDEGHAAVLGHAAEELLERLQPAGRGADARRSGTAPVPAPRTRLRAPGPPREERAGARSGRSPIAASPSPAAAPPSGARRALRAHASAPGRQGRTRAPTSSARPWSRFRDGVSRAWSIHHPVVLTNSSIATCVGPFRFDV